MTRKTQTTKFKSAECFKDRKCAWIYRFPIRKVLHPSFGRIEVFLEPIVKRGRINSLCIEFRQHDLSELKGSWEILTPQADTKTGISTRSHAGGSFFGGVCLVVPCMEHRTLSFHAYPPDGTRALVIECLSTNIGVQFSKEAA